MARAAHDRIYNSDYAMECVEQYCAGNKVLGPKVWTMLVFESWRDAFNLDSRDAPGLIDDDLN